MLPDLGDIAIADQTLPVFRYQINKSSENFLENGDFSKGLWQAKVSNCRKSKEDAAIGMELRSEQGDTQRQYLSLWAKDDSACTASGAVADFDRDSTYLISLDYRRVSGSNPLICVWDGRKCAVRKDLIANDNDWHSTSMLYKPEKNSGRFELYLYADKGAFDETISDYSNVSIKKVDGGWLPVGQIKNPFDAGKTLVELAEGEHRLSTAALPLSDNLFREGSFESASLGTVAANCKKQSDDARLELNYVADATAGKYSIELAGDKDRACISSGMIDVSARGDSYFISYDYKIVEGEKAQICVWDGKECIYNKISMGSGSGWNHVGEAFRAETQPASISIYLYSPDQKGPGRVRYDNVIVRSFDSSILDSYRVYSEKEQELEVLDFEYVKISPIHYVLNFSKLPEKESLLVFQETFHPDWQLECGRDGKAMGWWDKMNVPSCTVGGETHFVANGFANGWFLDREALDEVKVKKDGSFSLDLRFTLNRWFYIGLAVSGFTFLFALALLFYASLKFFRPRQDKKVSEKYAQRD